MGQFFSDEEKKKARIADAEEEEVITFKDIDEIIAEKEKIYHETKIRMKEYDQRIGQHNLSLFGDPENEEWESKIFSLKEACRSPYARQHPISKKMLDVADEMTKLQLEYFTQIKFLKRFYTEIAMLLDATIERCVHYEGEIDKLKEEINIKDRENKQVRGTNFASEQPEVIDGREYKSDVTEEMVHDYLKRFGQRHIDAYNQAAEEGVYQTAWVSRNEFMKTAKSYFMEVHSHPAIFATRLFDKFSKMSWSTFVAKGTKRRPPEKDSSPAKRKSPEQRSLSGNQGSNNASFDQRSPNRASFTNQSSNKEDEDEREENRGDSPFDDEEEK